MGVHWDKFTAILSTQKHGEFARFEFRMKVRFTPSHRGGVDVEPVPGRAVISDVQLLFPKTLGGGNPGRGEIDHLSVFCCTPTRLASKSCLIKACLVTPRDSAWLRSRLLSGTER